VELIPEPEKAYLLTNCYTAATCTTPALSSLLTGLYPRRHGVTKHGRQKLPEEYKFLPEVLRNLGYVTSLCFSDFNDKAYERLGLGRGFMYSVGGVAGSKYKGNLKPDFLKEARKYLREPWFLLIHSYATHLPYGKDRIPEDYGTHEAYEIDIDSRTEWNYEAEALYTERAGKVAREFLPGLYSFCEEEGTIMMILSDHGETFQGVVGHGHVADKYTAPMLLAFLGVTSGVDDELHSIVDIYPTMMSQLGLDPGEVDGVPIGEKSHESVVCINDFTTKVKTEYTIYSDGTEKTCQIEDYGVELYRDEEILARLEELGYKGAEDGKT
jgi:hypothetical protein